MSRRITSNIYKILHILRSIRVQAFTTGVVVEQPCFIGAGCRIHTGSVGRISIGSGSRLSERVYLYSEGRLVIEPGVFINRDCMIVALGEVIIGAATRIGERVSIRDHDHRFSDTRVRIAEQGYDIAPVRIGADCWIGCNAVVIKGVSIGRHAVVGASSVVTRNLPPFSVAAGAPARVLRLLPQPIQSTPEEHD
jgi:acetyltransferase-like isoleucine patch superfamily enzyme